MSDLVKVLDAGDKVLLSGQEAADVEAKLRYYVGRGSIVVSPVARIGSAWVAACTPPTQEADRSSTLDLAKILEAQRALGRRRSSPRATASARSKRSA